MALTTNLLTNPFPYLQTTQPKDPRELSFNILPGQITGSVLPTSSSQVLGRDTNLPFSSAASTQVVPTQQQYDATVAAAKGVLPLLAGPMLAPIVKDPTLLGGPMGTPIMKVAQVAAGNTATKKQFYRIGTDIYEAGTDRKIGATEWNRDWTGRATEVSAPRSGGGSWGGTATTQNVQQNYPTATTGSTYSGSREMNLPENPIMQYGASDMRSLSGLQQGNVNGMGESGVASVQQNRPIQNPGQSFNAAILQLMQKYQSGMGASDQDLLNQRNQQIAEMNRTNSMFMNATGPESMFSADQRMRAMNARDATVAQNLGNINTAIQLRDRSREQLQKDFQSMLEAQKILEEGNKPLEIGGRLVQLNPTTGKYEEVYTPPVSAQDKAANYETIQDPQTGAWYRYNKLTNDITPVMMNGEGFTTTPKGSSGSSSGLTASQLKMIESSPEAKKLSALSDLKSKLNAYQGEVNRGDFEFYGSRSSTLDSLYADLQVAWKEAANLGALTGPDLALIQQAVKPISGAMNYPGFIASGGKQGVLNSINTALKTLNTSGEKAADILNAKFSDISNDPYIQQLTSPFNQQRADQAAIDEMNAKAQALRDSGKYNEEQIQQYFQQRFNNESQTSLKGNVKKTSIGTITTKYGGSTRFEKKHPGLDLANKIGTPIPSTVGGTVVEVVTGKVQSGKGYGNYVVVKDQNGNMHKFSHLSSANVKVGDRVPAGYTIGKMGNSGAAYSVSGGTGSHLDYRVKNAKGEYINPNQFFG